MSWSDALAIVRRRIADVLDSLFQRRVVAAVVTAYYRKVGGRFLPSRRRVLRLFGASMYAVFLIMAPFEHHDLACHLKNPRHCTSCTASVVGSDPQTPDAIGAARLADAGSASVVQTMNDGVLLTVRSPGRSPPSHA